MPLSPASSWIAPGVHGHVRVWPIGAASIGSKGEDIAELRPCATQASFRSDDGKTHRHAKLPRQIMDSAAASISP